MLKQKPLARKRGKNGYRLMIEQRNDPLLALWKEWNRLNAENEAQREDASEMEMIAWGKRRVEIGKLMTKHVPLTPESAAVLVQLLTYWAKYGSPSDDQQEKILSNLLIWIERKGDTS